MRDLSARPMPVRCVQYVDIKSFGMVAILVFACVVSMTVPRS